MSAISYIATRSLMAGHTASTVYDFDQAMLDTGLAPSREVKRTTLEALDGLHRETLRQWGRTKYDCRTAPMTAAQLAQMVEFLDSCEEATFTFDPYGTVAVPDAPFIASIATEGYAVETVLRMTGGGRADLYSIAFTVIPAA
jgi:hypothetical protein